LRRRIEFGIRLYQEGAAPLLLLSGGGRGPVPEAKIMGSLARGAGIAPEALLIEAESRNTVENALRSARLLQARHISRIILVSDRVHLPRAALLFRLAGLRVVGCAAVPASSRIAAFVAALHETAAFPRSLARILLQRR
jgi:uncharacterized SAM-binding protein YcdF (DUF218 family)